MRDFKTLTIWQRSHALTLDVYRSTRSFPREEQYGITSQLRRSCVSIPTNIAEGCGRDGDRDFARFLQIAMSSASETEYQLILAKDLGYIVQEDFNQLYNELIEIKRMLNAFLQKLRASR